MDMRKLSTSELEELAGSDNPIISADAEEILRERYDSFYRTQF